MQTATVQYQSNDDYMGSDSFTYVVSDGLDESAPATVNIEVARNHRPPRATWADFTGAEDTAFAIVLSGHDPDIWDPGILSYAVTDAPLHGTLSGTPPNLSYTPAPDYYGTDTLSFTTSDGEFTSEPAALAIVVTPVNDPPVVTIEGEGPLAAGEDYPFQINATVHDVDTGDTHAVIVEWGDGEIDYGKPPYPDGSIDNVLVVDGGQDLAVSGSHHYFALGAHTVKVCASDSDSYRAPAPTPMPSRQCRSTSSRWPISRSSSRTRCRPTWTRRGSSAPSPSLTATASSIRSA